MTVYIGTKILP